jgi:hypothetical protein
MRTAQGAIQLAKVYGSDDLTIVRPLKKGHYQLYVENTSGIGFINAFTWYPPPGWTIKSITNITGARCSLVSGSVACKGTVDPPKCLCLGDGGGVTVDLAVSAIARSTEHGHLLTRGVVGAKLELNAMTPVPFLIPGTPKEYARSIAAAHGA